MLIRDNYLNQIRPYIDKDLIKVITGMRRCGKTTMLKQIMEELKNNNIKDENIIFISLESRKYKQLRFSDELDEIVYALISESGEKKYIFIDEIQNVKDWEKSLNSYMVDLNCDLYISGSNSNLLSGELATHIAGRYIEIKVYPFSFKEILQYKNKLDTSKYEKFDEFDEYLEYGGLPYIQELEEGKIGYLSMLYDTIILKDVVKLYDVRDIDFLERLVDFLIENIGHLFSANSISRFMKHEKRKSDPDKILRYIKLLRNALIFSKVKREDVKGKEILSVNEKYYLMDHGFYKALIRDNTHNKGQKLENIVYNELIRRGYKVTIGIIGEYEVDFVCKKEDNTIYVQVSEKLINETTINREINSLLKINDNFPKYILSLDNDDYSRNGIKHMHIIDFLLDENI